MHRPTINRLVWSDLRGRFFEPFSPASASAAIRHSRGQKIRAPSDTTCFSQVITRCRPNRHQAQAGLRRSHPLLRSLCVHHSINTHRFTNTHRALNHHSNILSDGEYQVQKTCSIGHTKAHQLCIANWSVNPSQQLKTRNSLPIE